MVFSFYLKKNLLLLYYSYPNFFPFAVLCPAHPLLPQSILRTVVHVHGSFIQVLCLVCPLLSTIIPLLPPLWLLFHVSMLWVYFAG